MNEEGIKEIAKKYDIPEGYIQDYLFYNSPQRFLFCISPYIPGTIKEKHQTKHRILEEVNQIKEEKRD